MNSDSLIAFLNARLLEDAVLAAAYPGDVVAAAARRHPCGPLRWIVDVYRRIDEHRMLSEKIDSGGWSPEAAAVIQEQRDYVVRCLQLAAEAYDQHPDYDSAWRPE